MPQETEGSGQEAQESKAEGQKSDSQGGVDKAVQKLQFRLGNNERALNSVLDRVEQIQKSLEGSGKSKDSESSEELNSMLEGLGSEDEAVTVSGLTKALEGLSSSVQERVQKALESELEPVKESTRQSKVDRYWAEWAQEHPNVADRKQELLNETEEVVDEQYPHLEGEARRAALQVAFDNIVKREETRAKASGGKSEKPPGANVKPEGSKSPVPEGTQEPSLEELVLWRPE